MRLITLALIVLVMAWGIAARGASGPGTTTAPTARLDGGATAPGAIGRWTAPLPEQLSSQAGLEIEVQGLDDAARTIQVAVLTDHRGTFVWETRVQSHAGAARMHVDLREPAVWRAVDHGGIWSNYELSALREVAVQAFPPLPETARLRCQWSAAALGSSLAWCVPGPQRIALGQRWELRCAVDGVDAWVPEQSGLSLEWSEPDGAVRSIAPFLFQEFQAAATSQDGERLTALGAKHLRARARPMSVGMHRWRLRLGERTLAEGRVQVDPGTPPAFVHLDPARPRWFLDPDGHTFQPIGWVVAYPVDRPYGNAYRPYLEQHQTLAGMLRQVDAVAATGGNCLRMWLSDWWGGLEWNADSDAYLGTGRWNLRHAWQVDRVLERCAERGIRILFCHYNHVRLAQQYSWPGHPYRSFLAKPADYWSDPRAAAASDAVLSAAVARWADDPAVLAWDHMSESDLVSGGVWPAAKKHILARLDTLRARDPWHRPAGNHLCVHTHDPAFVRAPGLDFFTSNAYPQTAGLSADQGEAVRGFAHAWGDLAKPVLITEYGGHWAGEPPAQMRRALRSGLWAGLGCDLAGAPMAWWWNAISGDDLAGTWRAAAAFIAGDDPAAEDIAEHGFWEERRVRLAGSPAQRLPNAFQVGSNRLRRLVLLDPATTSRVEADPPATPAVIAAIDGLRAGRYRIDWWDDQHTAPLRRSVVEVDTIGTLELAIPSFTGVLALRLAFDPMAAPAQLPSSPIPIKPTPSSAPVALSWVVQPLVPPPPAALADQVIWEVPIALPQAGWNRPPRVSRNGRELPCAWSFLDQGRSWLLRLPGNTDGPVLVTVGEQSGAVWTPPLDAVGLHAEAVRYGGPALTDHAAYAAAFGAASGEHVRVRVDGLDQTGDATGIGAERSLTRYAGPLLLPPGELTFAVNADDGLSLAMDGSVVVAWTGSHGAEVENRPAENRWLHRGDFFSTAGFHTLEVFHHQGAGAQLARVGWGQAGESLGTLPAWRCDGRLPVAVEVHHDGLLLATLLPRLDLEIRAPRRRLGVLGLRGPKGAERDLVLPDAGWQEVLLGSERLPLRSLARQAEERSFALRWLDDGPAVEALAWDAPQTVTLEIAGRLLPEQRAAPGAPARWQVSAYGRNSHLRLLAIDKETGVTAVLVEGQTPPADSLLPGLGLEVTAAWFTSGHTSAALLAHVSAAMRAAGPTARLRIAPGLDRRSEAVRNFLASCRHFAPVDGP